MTDLAEKYNKNIRPLLDAMDRLRNLKVTSEGITLPSIVLVGDQSSGKSSVLESLASIRLPRGQGIATRVPLVLRLQSCQDPEDSSITVSYKDTKIDIQEKDIQSQVNAATNSLAGIGKGVVTDTAISLHIRKPNAPNLTMIDLPGITRVPVHGQSNDTCEQITAMIRKFVKPPETVILNVLSAADNFATCDSIRMSQEEDRKGERTLAVVTKVDLAPDHVYEKVTAGDVNIGLGYICVRNRTDDDGFYEEARELERELFEKHPSLAQLDKASVGIASLAERLTQIQANIIRMSLPEFQQEIEKALQERRRELEALPQDLLRDQEPLDVFLTIVDQTKSLMQETMLNGNYDKVLDWKEAHYLPRLDEMFQKFNNNLHDVAEEILPQSKTAEILLRMTEVHGLTLPNFQSPTLMKMLVREEIDKVSELCTGMVPLTHDFARNFAFDVIDKSASSFPNLQAAFKQEADNVLATSHRKCLEFVRRVLDKERSNVFTMNDYYIANIKKLRDHWSRWDSEYFDDEYISDSEVAGFKGFLDFSELVNQSTDYITSFEIKVSLATYMKVVHKRMADEIPLELKYSLENALLKTLRSAIVKAKMGQDLSTLMEENASTLQKRHTLRKRVEILTDCKRILLQLR